MQGKLQEIFEWFHRNPELSYEEYRTTEHIRQILTDAGIEILPLPLETGLAAVIRGEKEGPVRALRCDIDALPIQEETGLSYASETPGRMHACGHDFHITAGIGTALLLQERKEELAGTVKILFWKRMCATMWNFSGGCMRIPPMKPASSACGRARWPPRWTGL